MAMLQCSESQFVLVYLRLDINVLLRSFFFFRHLVFIRADHIDGSGIERVF